MKQKMFGCKICHGIYITGYLVYIEMEKLRMFATCPYVSYVSVTYFVRDMIKTHVGD